MKNVQYNLTLRRVRATLWQWNSRSVTYAECVSAPEVSSMQCTCAILSFVACPALLYFSTLSHKRKIFGKKNIEHNTCDLFSQQILSETYFILRRNERDMNINVYWPSLQYQLFLSDFNATSFSSTYFRKMRKYKFHWSPPSGSRVVPRRGTGMTELIVAFRKISKTD